MSALQVAFLGFGAGPRRCIGEPLAMLEIKLMLVVLLTKLRFTPDAAFSKASGNSRNEPKKKKKKKKMYSDLRLGRENLTGLMMNGKKLVACWCVSGPSIEEIHSPFPSTFTVL